MLETNLIRHCRQRADRIDAALVGFMSANGIHLLRSAVALIYCWFGLLKLLNASPAGELVFRTLSWLAPPTALLLVGGWEMLIGIGLMISRPLILRIVLLLMWLQIAGTFQVFVLLPQVVFQSGNPLLPTLEGQYAIKNLVLITAGLVIGSTLRRKS
jgi:hypothetical protein